MITVTGNFEAITGASTGYMTVTLVGYAGVARVSGTGVIVTTSVTTAVASSFSVSLFPNDGITPSGTLYDICFYDISGRKLGEAYYSITGSGTQDISTLVPTAMPSGTSLVVTGGVSSFNGRTGAVLPATGDYSFDQISGTLDASRVSGIVVSGAAWGSISGTLSAQADLAAALAAKANVSALATVATSGSYNDLSDKPTIAGQVNADWNAVSGSAQILNKPSLAAVATSGAYADLSGKPVLATVATSGSYIDLSNKPAIPAAQVQTDWNASTGMGVLLNKPSLATVATSGAYSDLSGKPSLATVATSGSYSDLSNKPTIPAGPSLTTIVYSSTPTMDLSLGTTFLITLTGDATLSFSNGTAGQRYTLLVRQDATGGRTCSWGTGISGEVTNGTIASKTSVFNFVFDGTSLYQTGAPVLDQ